MQMSSTFSWLTLSINVMKEWRLTLRPCEPQTQSTRPKSRPIPPSSAPVDPASCTTAAGLAALDALVVGAAVVFALDVGAAESDEESLDGGALVVNGADGGESVTDDAGADDEEVDEDGADDEDDEVELAPPLGFIAFCWNCAKVLSAVGFTAKTMPASWQCLLPLW